MRVFLVVESICDGYGREYLLVGSVVSDCGGVRALLFPEGYVAKSELYSAGSFGAGWSILAYAKKKEESDGDQVSDGLEPKRA